MKIQSPAIRFSSSIFLILGIVSLAFSQRPDTLIQHLISQTNLDTVVHYVRVLSGEDSVTINQGRYLIQSRNASRPGNALAAEYISQTLQRTGLPTYTQNYSTNGANVFGVQTGVDYPEQEFIICAHYDAVTTYCADDNASGTAAVLEAARILSQVQTPYTVIYALWDEEENGLIGSHYYAQQAYQSGQNILGVLNLEMLGWDSNDDGLIDVHTRDIANSTELANMLVFVNSEYQIGLDPAIYNPGTGSSDHGSFWQAGYGAICFGEAYYGDDFNPYYHSSNDRIARFNLGYFNHLSQLAVGTISYLAFNSTTLDIPTASQPAIQEFVLKQNYPNPFNPTTTIEFTLPAATLTTLRIYNSAGQEVATLVSELLSAGNHKLTWNARNLPSGIYMYTLAAGNFHESRKLILLK
jgi:hypothetical protein